MPDPGAGEALRMNAQFGAYALGDVPVTKWLVVEMAVMGNTAGLSVPLRLATRIYALAGHLIVRIKSILERPLRDAVREKRNIRLPGVSLLSTEQIAARLCKLAQSGRGER